jgi:hypothetical protein
VAASDGMISENEEFMIVWSQESPNLHVYWVYILYIHLQYIQCFGVFGPFPLKSWNESKITHQCSPVLTSGRIRKIAKSLHWLEILEVDLDPEVISTYFNLREEIASPHIHWDTNPTRWISLHIYVYLIYLDNLLYSGLSLQPTQRRRQHQWASDGISNTS